MNDFLPFGLTCGYPPSTFGVLPALDRFLGQDRQERTPPAEGFDRLAAALGLDLAADQAAEGT